MAVVDHPRRVRPWLRNVAIAAFLILLPVAAHTAWDHYEARRLARTIAEIRANNEPVSAPDSERRDAGTWNNAARYYGAAAALIVADDLYSTLGLLARMDRASDADRPRVIEDIRAWLARNREAEEMLARATDLPFEGYPPGSNSSYRFDRLHRLARLADLRAMERVDAGDGQGAVRAIVQELRLTRPMQAAGPSDLSILGMSGTVRPAMRQLPSLLRTNPDEATLERLHAVVREHDVDNAIERATVVNRAFVLGQVWNEMRAWYRPPPSHGNDALLWYPLRPLFTRRLLETVRLQTELLTQSRAPWPARLDVAVGDPPGKPSGSLADFWGWGRGDEYRVRRSYKSRATTVASTLSLVRTADAAIAIERYRRSNGGAVPASLSQLVPGLLRSVPIDPFSGHEILYRPSPGGYVVYSVGANQKDDGGTNVEHPVLRSGAFQDRHAPPDLGVALALSSRPR